MTGECTHTQLLQHSLCACVFVPADYRGEQEGELETLRCIYTDEELTEVSGSPPAFQIRAASEHEDINCTNASLYSPLIFP